MTANGAAVTPSQWGPSKAFLRPYLNQISGVLPNVYYSFTGIVDVIGGEPPPGFPARPNVQTDLSQLNPGKLILLLPGAPQDFGTTAVTTAALKRRRLLGGDSAGAVMKTTLKIGSLALVLVSAASLFAQSSKWPTIRPLAEKKVFIDPGQNNTDTPFAAFVKGSKVFRSTSWSATTEIMKTNRR